MYSKYSMPYGWNIWFCVFIRCVCWLSRWNQLVREGKRPVWGLKQRSWRRSWAWHLSLPPKLKEKHPTKVTSPSHWLLIWCFHIEGSELNHEQLYLKLSLIGTSLFLLGVPCSQWHHISSTTEIIEIGASDFNTAVAMSFPTRNLHIGEIVV